jgi:outer membrane immunogenic protein
VTKIASAVVALVALFAAAAMAADLMPVYKAPAPVAPMVAYNWNGFYVGVHIGGAWEHRDFSQTTTSGPLVESATLNSSSFAGGGQIGFNWTLAKILLGLEADMSGTDLSGNAQTFNLAGTGPGWTQTTDIFGTARARLGVIADDWLFYGTGGLAWADDQFTRTQLTGDPALTPPVGFVVSNHGTRIGWTAGAGVEWGFARNWSAKLEYLFMDFGSSSFSFTVPAGTFAVDEGDLTLHTVRVGVNYRFR